MENCFERKFHSWGYILGVGGGGGGGGVQASREKNTISYKCSYEATKAVAKKALSLVFSIRSAIYMINNMHTSHSLYITGINCHT